ncbi:TetR/AcrR family transcriptional regulator [Virgisporangium aurantiacum]|uniref:TetR family transcriptional regulator n=1 Tax=Virgisporangium aurantiacum TaxID=175570 RepID=A0A8J3ZBP9_9ACTN|nr:TetR/AcrR family transcriptional regulator [Virgisporangium aurantiacum]GIJ59992.1 TetR family transcriptional regulator [Virgisporangium aurantiacum]
MATEYTGTGDPVRSMELLWGVEDTPGTKRGPRPRLRMAEVVQKAIALADRHGLAALSMRRLAEELGVTAMSLYTYVPGKGELLDLMTDAVCAETARPEPGGRTWRERLTQIATENWALYQRHPWLLQVATNRPVLGPNLIAKYDYELRAVDGLGLTDVEMDMTIALLADFVHGSVRGEVNQAQAQQHTGMTELEWWEKFQPLLAKVYDAERFPTATRVGAAAGEEFQAASAPQRTFTFGLERLLDGVEKLIQTRS